MQWYESDVNADGLNIHIYRSGGENGDEKPPFVLLHGATDNGLCWPRVAEALAPDYELIAPDARGHGKSDKPQTGYSADDHARDVAGVIRALELQRPIVAGHSMGALTTAVFAAAYPELVSAIILEDPPWREPNPDFIPEEQAALRRRTMLERKMLGEEEIVRRGKADNPGWSDVEFEHWGEAKMQVSEDTADAIITRGYAWHDASDLIQCPALLMLADPELGGLTSPETAAHIAQANPNIIVRRIPNAGHSIRRDQFDAYMSAVREFLAGM